MDVSIEYAALGIAAISSLFSGIALWQVQSDKKESKKIRAETKIERMISHLEKLKYHNEARKKGIVERIEETRKRDGLTPEIDEELNEIHQDITANTDELLKDINDVLKILMKAETSKVSSLELEQLAIQIEILENTSKNNVERRKTG